MIGFEFKKKPTVNICGKDYEFDPSNNDLLQGIVSEFPRILAAAYDMQELSRKLKKERSSTLGDEVLEKNKELMIACRGFIEGCLGVDEYAEIFHKRRPNSTEHVDLCRYLYEAMMEGREDILAEYLGEDENAVDKAPEEP